MTRYVQDRGFVYHLLTTPATWSLVEDVLLHAVPVLGVPQPDPRAVQALVKLCPIVPPPPRDQPQPPGVTLETSSLSHRHQTSSCPDLYPRVHGAALLGVVLRVEGAPAVSVVRVGHEASLQRVPASGYQQVVSSAVHVTSLARGIIVTS